MFERDNTIFGVLFQKLFAKNLQSGLPDEASDYMAKVWQNFDLFLLIIFSSGRGAVR